MRIVYLLLHDFNFASMGFDEFSWKRFHFSKEYARRMAEAGHDVKLYVFTEDATGRKSVRTDGYEIKGFGSSVRFPPLLKFGNNHSLDALKEIEDDAPDVVHLHNYYLWNFAYVAPWIRRLHIPLVAQFHGGDPIRRLKGHAFFPSLMACDKILVPTSAEKAFLVRSVGLPVARVTLSPSTGVDTAMFHRVGERDPEPTVVYVGRLPRPANYRWEKAPRYLPDLLRTLIRRGLRARLIVAGDGPGLPAFVSRVKDLGIQDSVEFLGNLDQTLLPKLYSRAWLTFVPMHMDDVEPFWGGTVQESLACGTPVMAFNDSFPGAREYGFLIRPRAEAAAELIETALNGPARLSEMGERGAKFVKANCEWGEISKHLESLYGSIHSSTALGTQQRQKVAPTR